MSNLVSPSEIESIVGVPRHPTEHWGRAVSAEQTVYVLHSSECTQSTPDLRDCPYSVALDWGIESIGVWPLWAARQDIPVRLAIDSDGLLAPDDAGSDATAGEPS